MRKVPADDTCACVAPPQGLRGTTSTHSSTLPPLKPHSRLNSFRSKVLSKLSSIGCFDIAKTLFSKRPKASVVELGGQKLCLQSCDKNHSMCPAVEGRLNHMSRGPFISHGHIP
jgi:hypothetical protein